MGCIHAILLDVADTLDTFKVEPIKHITAVCECPPAVSFENMKIKPRMCTPMDKLGYPRKCCGCCPVGLASFFFCMLTFAWGSYELQCADYTMSHVFPDRGEIFYYFKMSYLFLCLLLILASGGLLLGIIVKRFEPVHVYVWYGFIFNCLLILFVIGSTVFIACREEAISKEQTWKICFGIIWSVLFFYILMVVNSYKLNLWYHTIGF